MKNHKKFKEKNDVYSKNNDKWAEFEKNYKEINEWLDAMLTKVNDLKIKSLEYSKLMDIAKVIY